MRRNHLIKVLTFRQQISLSTRSVQMRASRSIQVRKFLPRSSNVRRLKKPHNDPKRKKWANDWKARSQDLFTRGIKETNKWVVSLGLKALYLRSTKVTRTSNQETKAFTRISPVPPTNPPTCVTSTSTQRPKWLKTWTRNSYFWRKKTLSFLMLSRSTRLSSLIAWWAKSFRGMMQFILRGKEKLDGNTLSSGN